MASNKDLADLASLLKQTRKAARKLERQGLPPASSSAQSKVVVAPPANQVEPERFADYFKPWSKYQNATEQDLALFRNTIKGTTPLQQTARADTGKHRPLPHAKLRNADEIAALQASQLAMEPSPMSWDIGADIEDEQSYLRAGVNPDLLRKLRRGQWTIQAELDLHHHNQDEAHAALGEFMRIARESEWRCIRIIHGKGLSSHQKIPVLRNKVRRWLQQKNEVLAYCEPRPNGGGSGAVLVLLKGGK